MLSGRRSVSLQPILSVLIKHDPHAGDVIFPRKATSEDELRRRAKGLLWRKCIDNKRCLLGNRSRKIKGWILMHRNEMLRYGTMFYHCIQLNVRSKTRYTCMLYPILGIDSKFDDTWERTNKIHYKRDDIGFLVFMCLFLINIILFSHTYSVFLPACEIFYTLFRLSFMTSSLENNYFLMFHYIYH